MRVEVWSDVVCPWCYIGKRRLEGAIEALGEAVEVEFRSFELDPRAAKSLDGPLIEALAKKYGTTVQHAEQMQQHVARTAAADGLQMNFDVAKTGNTFDAHRLLHFAKTQGMGNALKERLLKAYFTDGRAISDADTLSDLAAEVGLDRAAAAEVLATDAFAQDVRRDEAQAQAYGCRGVPFFVIDGKYGVSGAQPTETLLQVLRQVQQESAPVAPEGEVCDDDGCAI